LEGKDLTFPADERYQKEVSRLKPRSKSRLRKPRRTELAQERHGPPKIQSGKKQSLLPFATQKAALPAGDHKLLRGARRRYDYKQALLAPGRTSGQPGALEKAVEAKFKDRAQIT